MSGGRKKEETGDPMNQMRSKPWRRKKMDHEEQGSRFCFGNLRGAVDKIGTGLGYHKKFELNGQLCGL